MTPSLRPLPWLHSSDHSRARAGGWVLRTVGAPTKSPLGPPLWGPEPYPSPPEGVASARPPPSSALATVPVGAAVELHGHRRSSMPAISASSSVMACSRFCWSASVPPSPPYLRLALALSIVWRASLRASVTTCLRLTATRLARVAAIAWAASSSAASVEPTRSVESTSVEPTRSRLVGFL
jgi:hypothetical protein